MKLFIILLLAPALSFSQGYLNVEGTMLYDVGDFLGGPIFFIGGFLKDREGNGVSIIGGGVGLFIQS